MIPEAIAPEPAVIAWKRLDRAWVCAFHRAPDGDDANEILVFHHDVVEVAVRLFEQEPSHGLSIEMTVDLMLRPMREVPGPPAALR